METERLILRQLAGRSAWSVVHALLESDRPLTQAEIALAIGRSQPAVSRALAALARASLVESARVPDRLLGRPAERWQVHSEKWKSLIGNL